MSDRLILTGDIGGTKSNLGLFHGDNSAPELLADIPVKLIAEPSTVLFGAASQALEGLSERPRDGHC